MTNNRNTADSFPMHPRTARSARACGLGAAIAMIVACQAGAPARAYAQSETVGDTVASVLSVTPASGSAVASEHARFASTEKAKKLIEFAKSELGITGTLSASTSSGFLLDGTLRFQKAGSTVATDQPVRITFVPYTFTGKASRFPSASLAMMYVSYRSATALDYPRLMIRYGNNGAMVEEFAFRKDKKVTKMTAKFGDCVFRSGLRLLEQRKAATFKSLQAVFDGSAKQKVADTLQKMYDPRQTPVGQKTLFLYSGLLIVSNYEEEFDAGFIDGSIDTAFKPVRGDSNLVTQIKALAKDIFKQLLQQAGKKLWEAILGWL